MWYVSIYAWDEEAGRWRPAAHYGFSERAVAEREVVKEREFLIVHRLHDRTVRLTIRTPDGAFIDAPDEERDVHYSDRGALARLLGDLGL
jgi:hypothetical protein